MGGGSESEVQLKCVRAGGRGGRGLEHQGCCLQKPAFGEAPCLIGGREVNFSVPKLYLIFIHIKLRSITANKLNVWVQGGPVERKEGGGVDRGATWMRL